MGFDEKWFDELRSLSEQKISVVSPKTFRPTVDELVVHGLASNSFLNTTLDLVKALNKTKYPFDVLFRVYPHHICNFSRGKAFRKQWNIGFFAGEIQADDYARIGIGFSMNCEMSQQGVDEYVDFLSVIAARREDFDHTLSLLGNYAEPSHLSSKLPLSSAVISDQINIHDDWRFFGKCLRYDSEKDQKTLHSVDKFVEEAVTVFDLIKNSGFV